MTNDRYGSCSTFSDLENEEVFFDSVEKKNKKKEGGGEIMGGLSNNISQPSESFKRLIKRWANKSNSVTVLVKTKIKRGGGEGHFRFTTANKWPHATSFVPAFIFIFLPFLQR